MKRNLTDKDKERIASEALANLFERDTADIVTDPKYMKSEQGPIPFVKQLRAAIKKLRNSIVSI
jgi:hypothetical protein